MGRILLIEDDPSVASALRDLLVGEGFSTTVATDATQGLTEAMAGEYDIVVTDLQMPGPSGLHVIEQLQIAKPYVPVIMMTAHHTTETAISATKLGAYDYLIKPIQPAEFLGMIRRALESTQLKARPTKPAVEKENIVGRSRLMQGVYKEIGRVAAMPVTVLIRGETGTGKELVARSIHQHSGRVAAPFVTVNCAAIPENLLESELFGHEAGAFTGARARHLGKFEQANRGTLFLDEIGDMSTATQVKLLRVLQEKTIQRVGGKEPIPVDVRIIAATHRNLEEAMAAKEFRADLFHRLNVAVIQLPPLAERREDIPDLALHFLARYGADFGFAQPRITDEALELLTQQPWQGNVRELENVLRKALLASRGFPISFENVRAALRTPTAPQPAANQSVADYVARLLADAQSGDGGNVEELVMDAVERELYGQAIRLAGGDQSKAARWLGVSRPTMREKLTRYGLFPVRREHPSVLRLPQMPVQDSAGASFVDA
jgi:two-component system, NtrC family, response regulator